MTVEVATLRAQVAQIAKIPEAVRYATTCDAMRNGCSKEIAQRFDAVHADIVRMGEDVKMLKDFRVRMLVSVAAISGVTGGASALIAKLLGG